LDGKCLDSFVRGQNQQIDFSAARLEFHLVHHRKRSISSRADYEALALPGYLFLDRDRGTSELFAEFFRGLLLALANPAAVKELSRYLSFLAILLHGGFFSFSSPIVSIGRGLPLLQFQQPQLSSSLAPAIVWNTASALRSIETLLK
jgi:hypothetical protein